jgi:hypothetical protein
MRLGRRRWWLIWWFGITVITRGRRGEEGMRWEEEEKEKEKKERKNIEMNS